MSETVTETEETAEQTAEETAGGTEETPPKFAGKYDDDEAALKGTNELREKMGLDPVEKLYGEDGLYASRAAAERGYKEMTKLQRTARPSAEQAEPMKLGGEETETDEPITPQQILERAELDFADLEKQYAEHGELTPEQYTAIRKSDPSLKNVSTAILKTLVDNAARGMIATAKEATQAQAAMRAEAAEIVGGEDVLEMLLKTAPSFVPKNEFEDLAERLKNPKWFRGAARDLKQFHADSVGAGKSKPIVGGGEPSGSGGAKNSAEYHRLVRAAAAGDEAARRKVDATPRATIQKWQSTATF